MPRTINLRGIPEDLFRNFKIACATNDTDMSSALKSLMGDYIRSGGKVAGRGAVKPEKSDKSGIKQAGPRRGSENG